MTTTSKNLHELASFDDLIAKRREAVGGSGSTFPVPGFGKTWHVAAPDLQSAEWSDRHAELLQDAQDGYISTAEFREKMLELYLADQADDFAAACDKEGMDPFMLVQDAVAAYGAFREENPIRPSSRNGRPRAKRR